MGSVEWKIPVHPVLNFAEIFQTWLMNSFNHSVSHVVASNTLEQSYA